MFYCDPLYLHETRTATQTYAFEMTLEQHEELLENLTGIKGKSILSGYRSQLYDRYARREGCVRDDILIDNKASSRKTKATMTECLWTNYEFQDVT